MRGSDDRQVIHSIPVGFSIDESRGIVADDDRQAGEAAQIVDRNNRPLLVDQLLYSAMLPDRQWPALDQPDEQSPRQAALDRRGTHPRQGFELLLRAMRADRQDRSAAYRGQRRHDRRHIGRLAAFDLDIRYNETEGSRSADDPIDAFREGGLSYRCAGRHDRAIAADNPDHQQQP